MESKQWGIGDSVMVKPGITERVTGGTISGWQGRLLAFEEKRERLTIQWDSLTLKRLPFAYIARCEDWSVSWSTMRLAAQDLLPVGARDREEEVVAALAALERQVSWLSLGEQGMRIRQIVNRGEAHDLFTSYDTWRAYLQEHLVFPFVATVVEAQRGPVPQGAQVTVTGISLVDDTMGIIVRSRLKRRVYHFPLCELRSTMVSAEMQQLIEDYAKWFRRYLSIYARSPL
jgi:hypothetical protein